MRVKTPLLGVTATGGLTGVQTAWGGYSSLILLGRKCGLIETGNRVLPQKVSSQGLRSGQMLECFVLSSAMGGDCYEDMEQLRSDPGLAAILGYRPPSAEAARQWLDKFHDELLMAGRPLQGSFLPPESTYLAGLEELKRKVVWAYVAAVLPPTWRIPESERVVSGIGRPCIGYWASPGMEAMPIVVTLDIDAHLVETHKEGAKVCYDGYPAFQPLIVTWAETALILVDEFREGNVPASVGTIGVVNKAVNMLPAGSWKIRIRSDSAAYEQENLGPRLDRGLGREALGICRQRRYDSATQSRERGPAPGRLAALERAQKGGKVRDQGMGRSPVRAGQED